MINSTLFQDRNAITCKMVDELFNLLKTDCDYNIDINDFQLNIINNNVEATFDALIEALERRSGISSLLYQNYNEEIIDHDTTDKINIFKKIKNMQEEFNQMDYVFSSCDGGIKFMNIKTKINTIFDDKRKIKAYATVTLDNQFTIHGVKVLKNKNGNVFVTMPQVKNSQGNYQDVCHPNNSDLRNAISESVIGEYTAELKIRNENEQSDEIEESSNDFEQSM
jgi:stage V sporulation protein G